jgi:hypothetical protein
MRHCEFLQEESWHPTASYHYDVASESQLFDSLSDKTKSLKLMTFL